MSTVNRCDECGKEAAPHRTVGWFTFDVYGIDDRRFLEWRNGLPLHFCSPRCAVRSLEKVARTPVTDSPDFFRDFVRDEVVRVEGGEVDCREMFGRYKAWALRAGLGPRDMPTAAGFGRNAAELFPRIKRRDGWSYVGVALRSSVTG